MRRNVVFVGNLGGAQKTFEKTGDDGKNRLMLERVPIFRSGTFADSNGFVHEWDPLHIHQMVDNFTLLFSRGIFSDVPIRKHHRDWGGIFSDPARNPMDELMGYLSNLQSTLAKNPTDGNEYEYLLADFELLHDDAIKGVGSGLWRNLSAEISPYITNTNAEYYPTIMGVAYVDIPAVEGLKVQLSKADPANVSLILEESMTQPVHQTTLVPPANHSISITPPPPPPTKKDDEVPPTSFSIAGKATTDHAAVQAHITQLESQNAALVQFRTESLEAARVNYVKLLVKDNKIPAPQEESYISYAKSLDDAGFEAWKKLQDAAPAMTLTNPQGAGFSTSVPEAQGSEAAMSRKDTLVAIIHNHQLAGMPAASIEKLKSYTELKQLDPAFSL